MSPRLAAFCVFAVTAHGTIGGCAEKSVDTARAGEAPEGAALGPCSPNDFVIPAPARPSSGAAEGTTSLLPKGKATVRFHGRASGEASWVASFPSDLAYAYFDDEPGGRVSFDLRLDEEGQKGRTTTVRLSHVWRSGADGQLCSAPRASLSIHENIDDESVEAIPGTVDVRAFDPDGHHLGVAFEAETTAYKIFIDVDVVGAAR